MFPVVAAITAAALIDTSAAWSVLDDTPPVVLTTVDGVSPSSVVDGAPPVNSFPVDRISPDPGASVAFLAVRPVHMQDVQPAHMEDMLPATSTVATAAAPPPPAVRIDPSDDQVAPSSPPASPLNAPALHQRILPDDLIVYTRTSRRRDASIPVATTSPDRSCSPSTQGARFSSEQPLTRKSWKP